MSDPRLSAWVVAARRAARGQGEPLTAWARLSAQPEADPCSVLRDLSKPGTRSGGDQPDAGVVIDYAAATPEQWIQDGYTFGAGPGARGQVRLGTDPARPIERVFDTACAEQVADFVGASAVTGLWGHVRAV